MRIGIITSGGDSPGMNAAIRAVTALRPGPGASRWSASTRAGRAWWTAATSSRRSTGAAWAASCRSAARSSARPARMPSARCTGRRQAARNLVDAGIDGLVVIGGDGSLTGALLLYQEWADAPGGIGRRGADPGREGGESGAVPHRRAARLDRQRPVRHRHEHRRGHGAATRSSRPSTSSSPRPTRTSAPSSSR